MHFFEEFPFLFEPIELEVVDLILVDLLFFEFGVVQVHFEECVHVLNPQHFVFPDHLEHSVRIAHFPIVDSTHDPVLENP